MSVLVLVEKPSRAFLPEVAAYLDYFNQDERFSALDWDFAARGAQVDAQVHLRFLGWVPKWASRQAVLVGDLNSLSVGHLRWMKDWTKARLGREPDLKVALNGVVAKSVGWSPEETILRPMGFFGDYLRPRLSEPEFDLVYAGSTQRSGVWTCLEALASKGFRVAVIGSTAPPRKARGLTDLGRRPLSEVYEIYSRSYAGLNIVPSTMPYIVQDSTKTIEYCAAGMGVVTNRYAWIDQFERSRHARFLDLKRMQSPDTLYAYDFVVPNVVDLDWRSILKRSGLADRVLLALGQRGLG